MKRRITAILTALSMLTTVGATTVSAATPTSVEQFAGNYQCPAGSTGVDPVVSGTYALVGGGSITITVISTTMGDTFNFTTSDATVGSIVVKGGTGYLTYMYTAATSDSGLHAPLNLKNRNNQWYGLSHLCIQSAKKGAPGPKK